MSESKKNDKGRENKKSDNNDIPNNLSLVGSAGLRKEELKYGYVQVAI